MALAIAFRSFLLIFGEAAIVTSSISSRMRGISDKSDSFPARKSDSFQISRSFVVTADIIRPLGQPASIRSWPLTGNLGSSQASMALYSVVQMILLRKLYVGFLKVVIETKIKL